MRSDIYLIMTTLFPIDLNCPVCGKSFQSSEVGSCGFASKRTDFRPNYWGFNPVEYFYHLCPHCGFCGNGVDFKEEAAKQFKIQGFIDKINSLGPLEQNSLETKIERAMICLEAKIEFAIAKRNEYNLANAWLDAFWWASSPNQIEKCGKIVTDYFKQALEKNLVPEKDIPTVNYLIGEISRRIGKQDEALKFFDETISLSQNNEDLKNLYQLAVQQKTEPKENL